MSQITTEAAGTPDAGQGTVAPQAAAEPSPTGSDGTAGAQASPATAPASKKSKTPEQWIGIGKQETWRDLEKRTGGRIRTPEDLEQVLAALDAPADDAAEPTHAPAPTPRADAPKGQAPQQSDDPRIRVRELERELTTHKRDHTRLSNEATNVRAENASLRSLIAFEALKAAAATAGALYPEDVAKELKGRLRIDLSEGSAEIVVLDEKGQATDDTPAALVGGFTQKRPNWFGQQQRKAGPPPKAAPIGQQHTQQHQAATGNGAQQPVEWNATTIAARMNARIAEQSGGGREQG